ncbi:MAG TPA: hypothetical protein VFV85_00450 [Conexibacter sp.]|nr:hypothetical protein [Conexibacter sp.]
MSTFTHESLRAMRRIGHVTPSCNTALEPLCCAIAPPALGVSHHFSRLGVRAIALAPDELAQFEAEPMVAAARSLTDAHVHAIAWNGTSGSWTGLEQDEAICAAISAELAVPATTTTLAIVEAVRASGLGRIAIATPYTADVNERIVATYAAAGVEVVASAGLGIVDGAEMAYPGMDEMRALLRAADHPDAQAIAVVCTGMPAAVLADELERELGKPLLDSIAVTVWKALALVGVDCAIGGWGALLRGELGAASATGGGVPA